MNKLPLGKGRINQKLKTRVSILSAAKRLMENNKKISLEDVAKEANISRATIYRYFSSIDLLIMEASLHIQHLDIDEIQNEVQKLSLVNRILYIQEYYNKLAQKNEIGFRRYMSAALTESITNREKVRGARRVESLKKSLAPFKKQIGKQQFENLINIASVLMGIDALIVTKDVCDLNNDESSNLLGWGVQMILKGMQIEDL